MRAKVRALVYVTLGHIFLATGVVGIIVPLLPTTPFVLLACGCYARGSKRFHTALLESKLFGRYIREWEMYGSIPVRGKVVAISMIVAGIGWGMYAAPFPFVKGLLLLIGAGVSAYILMCPSKKRA